MLLCLETLKSKLSWHKCESSRTAAQITQSACANGNRKVGLSQQLWEEGAWRFAGSFEPLEMQWLRMTRGVSRQVDTNPERSLATCQSDTDLPVYFRCRPSGGLFRLTCQDQTFAVGVVDPVRSEHRCLPYFPHSTRILRTTTKAWPFGQSPLRELLINNAQPIMFHQ